MSRNGKMTSSNLKADQNPVASNGQKTQIWVNKTKNIFYPNLEFLAITFELETLDG